MAYAKDWQMWVNKLLVLVVLGRRSGLMVSVLDAEARGLGSSPSQGHCVVFLGKTLYSQCLSPARYINGYQQT